MRIKWIAPPPFCRWETDAHDRWRSPQSCSQSPFPCRDPQTGLVVLGAHALRTSEPTRQVFGISAVIRHPDYQPMTHANDICLLQVSFMERGTARRSGLSPPPP